MERESRKCLQGKGVVLTYSQKTVQIIKCHQSLGYIAQQYQMSGETTSSTHENWPKEFQTYNIYISEEGIYELLFSSQ